MDKIKNVWEIRYLKSEYAVSRTSERKMKNLIYMKMQKEKDREQMELFNSDLLLSKEVK